MVKVFISGDVVNVGNDRSFISSELQKLVSGCDFSIINLEAPIVRKGILNPSFKAGHILQQRAETTKILKDAGYSAVGLSNNHIMDYGERGLSITQNACEEAGLQWFGAGSRAQAFRPLVVDSRGISIAFWGCGEMQFGALDQGGGLSHGYPWIFDPYFESLLQQESRKHDFTVVCPHAGLEDASVPLPQWRTAYRRLCHLGCDAVIASHPHVPQGYEVYNGKPIVYSLGNFYFDYGEYEAQKNSSYSVILKFDDKISIEPIEHKYNPNTLMVEVLSSLLNEELIVSRLNDMLASSYYDYVLDACADAFKGSVYPLFQVAMNVPASGSSLRTWLRFFRDRLRGSSRKQKYQNQLLHHMLRNESYRWAAEIFLSSND